MLPLPLLLPLGDLGRRLLGCALCCGMTAAMLLLAT
jgi:hypothetical protein